MKTNNISIENKEIVNLLKTKSPAEYVDYCVKSRLKTHEKAKLTKIWLKVTRYTIQDFEYARNRHPYWKKKKLIGSVERNKERLKKFNYYGNKKNKTQNKWDEKKLKEFLSLNDVKKDWELAKYFKRSIPAIQHVRRKIMLAKKLAKYNKANENDKRYIFKTILATEDSLRALYKSKSGKK
jgi:hypothetical protein